jgi:predicted RNA-binding protein with PIN domain
MPLIIDGYNLLHVTGITGRHGDLHGSREALLRYLAGAIEPKERALTTIVFDAAEAPPGLPRTINFEGLTVHFASNYQDADEQIEELIATCNVPRSLLVVSSDHRIQRAARRRRAQFVDSDVWMADISRRRVQVNRSNDRGPQEPQASLTADDVQYWIAEFTQPLGEDDEPSASQGKPLERGVDFDLKNPFPPGYGEDLLEDPP